MKKIFSQLPIRVKILSSSVLTLLLISLFIIFYYPQQQKKQVLNAMQIKNHSMAEMIALSTAIALGLDNYAAIIEAFEWAKRDKDLVYIIVLDENDEIIAVHNPDSLQIDIPYLLDRNDIIDLQGRLLHSVIVPIRYRNTNYGTLLLGNSLDTMYQTILSNTTTTLYISLAVLLLGIVISLVFSHMITKPVIQLRDAAERVADGNYDVTIEVSANDEVGILGNAFRKMVGNVRNAMEALRKSEKKLSDITATLREGVCVLDGQGILTFMNPEAEHLLGWKEQELLGKNMHQAIHYQNLDGSPRSASDCPIVNAVKEGKLYRNYDDIFITNEKKIIPVAYVTAPIIENGNISGSVLVFHDIKERKEFVRALKASEENYRILSEELAESNNMKELLLDIITHDLKNQAGVISGMAEILATENPDEEAIHIVKDSSDSLLKVIGNATTLAKVTLDEEIYKENLDVIEIIKQTAREFKPLLKSENIKLDFNLPDHLPAKVNPIIAEVFKNYISNAIKYAKDGKKIIIAARKEDGNIIIGVQDFGKTISDKDYQRVFERSVQLIEGKKRGRGLGLAIVKRIAKAHKGKAWVEANTPHGNIFYLQIPGPDQSRKAENGN